MKQLKPKFVTGNIKHFQADKGKTIVVIELDSHTELAARHPYMVRTTFHSMTTICCIF